METSEKKKKRSVLRNLCERCLTQDYLFPERGQKTQPCSFHNLPWKKALKCIRHVRGYKGQNVPECQSWKGPEGRLIHSPCRESQSSDRGRVAEGDFSLQGCSFEWQHTILLYLLYLSILTTVWIKLDPTKGRTARGFIFLQRVYLSPTLSSWHSSCLCFSGCRWEGWTWGQSWCKTGQRPCHSWQNQPWGHRWTWGARRTWRPQWCVNHRWRGLCGRPRMSESSGWTGWWCKKSPRQQRSKWTTPLWW